MNIYYANFPKITFSFPTTKLNYVVFKYYGNTAATSGNVISGNITSGTYITGDLSFNTLYTFTLTAYDATNVAGEIRNISIDTTPYISGVKATISNSSSSQLQWSGTYSYVKISRGFSAGINGNVSVYTDISTNVVSMPFLDKDLSGNTTYKYYITPYNNSGVASTSSNTMSLYTNVMAATDLSATFYDISAIRLSFTAPTKNNYVNSIIYTAQAIYNGVIYGNVSSSNSPILMQNLSSGTTYTCYIKTILDNLYSASSASLIATTKSPYISGLLFKMYSGYFNDNTSFFDTATLRSSPNTGYATDLTNIYYATNGIMPVNGADNYSVQWTGYFYTNSYSGSFTFYTNSDDSSLLWIGSYATSGYSTSNTTVNNSGQHGMQERSGSVTLSSNTYYPIRIMFGENGGGDDCQVSFTLPGSSTRIYNGTGYYYS